MPFFKLLLPQGFETKSPNYFRSKKIPTYFEVVEIKPNRTVETQDERVKDILERDFGCFVLVALGGVKQAKITKQEVEEEDFPYEELTFFMEDIMELSDTQKYCKVCGKAIDKEDIKRHVTEDHEEIWQEYERLPVMIPDCGLDLYWSIKELQEAFPEPINLLKGYGVYANYLDYIKMEGVHRSKKLAEYFEVAFTPRSKHLSKDLFDNAVVDGTHYCKICGAQMNEDVELDKHLISHGIDKTSYNNVRRVIPDFGMELWHKHADLRRSFPLPMDSNCGHGNIKNFDMWLRTYGVKQFKHVRAYYTGKSDN